MFTGCCGSTVSFHDIHYEVSVRKYPWNCPTRRVVLSEISGFMPPGMNAIMGPTGSGKSSLLDALAGRKNPANLSGYVLMDGQRQSQQVLRHLCGYVVQGNIVVGTLTVRENIAFSAALRLPGTLSSSQREEKVSSVIDELGLSSVADQLVGTEFIRGVSGGERKRTCIGIELVKDPSVLYLDEPTTGLDAYTALSVMKTLRRLADGGRTVVFSIHQPKYSIFRLFDRLTLLSEGHVVYHGPSGQTPVDYFGSLGYILEGYNNPADFLMDTLHGEASTGAELADPDEPFQLMPRLDATRLFVDMWRNSSLYQSCQAFLSEASRAYEASLSNRSTPRRSFQSRSFTETLLRRHDSDHHQESPRNSRVSPPASPTIRESASPSPNPEIITQGEEEESHPLAAGLSPTAGPQRIPSLALKSSNRGFLRRRFRSRLDEQCTEEYIAHQPLLSKVTKHNKQYATSFCRQLCLLIGRQWLSMIRDYKTILGHFAIQLFVAIFLSVIYYDLDYSLEAGIQNRVGLFFFACMQLMFITGSLLDTFMRDRALFTHETAGGFYRVSAYFFSKIIAEVLPVKALPAVIFLPLTYYLTGLRASVRAFFFWELTVTLVTITSSSVAFSVSTMTTDVRIAVTLLSMFFVLMMITGGFLINITTLGEWLRWLRYLSIVRLSMNVFMINELSGLRFCPSSMLNDSMPRNIQSSNSSDPPIELPPQNDTNCIYGEQYLETQAIDYQTDWAIWQNELGLVVVCVLALLNAYVYLRLVKRYQ